MNVLDLFSGIGGFSVGLEKAGFNTVAFCEIEPYCRAVLERHWPDTPIYDDVRSLTGEQLRADGLVPDVIVGGYPCQPFSLAGVRRGEKDDRHLWPEVRRLVAEIRPAWCIFENVAGHITMGLDEVLSDLETEGYAARPFVIPACGVDAPHRRDRVWIVGHAQYDGPSASGNIGFIQGEQSGSEKAVEQSARTSKRTNDVGDTQRGRQSGDARRRSGQEPENGCADVADTGSQGLQRDVRQGQASQKGQPQRHTPQCGRWPTEPNVGRVANGVPARSHRIKALGNAVVPQIPEVIGRIIMEVEANNERI